MSKTEAGSSRKQAGVEIFCGPVPTVDDGSEVAERIAMRGCMHQPIVTMSWRLAPTNRTGCRRRRLESMVNRLIGVNFR
jgi:hypothetical protein